jgi:hypothetical protein
MNKKRSDTGIEELTGAKLGNHESESLSRIDGMDMLYEAVSSSFPLPNHRDPQ